MENFEPTKHQREKILDTRNTYEKKFGPTKYSRNTPDKIFGHTKYLVSKIFDS